MSKSVGEICATGPGAYYVTLSLFVYTLATIFKFIISPSHVILSPDRLRADDGRNAL